MLWQCTTSGFSAPKSATRRLYESGFHTAARASCNCDLCTNAIIVDSVANDTVPAFLQQTCLRPKTVSSPPRCWCSLQKSNGHRCRVKARSRNSCENSIRMLHSRLPRFGGAGFVAEGVLRIISISAGRGQSTPCTCAKCDNCLCHDVTIFLFTSAISRCVERRSVVWCHFRA